MSIVEAIRHYRFHRGHCPFWAQPHADLDPICRGRPRQILFLAARSHRIARAHSVSVYGGDMTE